MKTVVSEMSHHGFYYTENSDPKVGQIRASPLPYSTQDLAEDDRQQHSTTHPHRYTAASRVKSFWRAATTFLYNIVHSLFIRVTPRSRVFAAARPSWFSPVCITAASRYHRVYRSLFTPRGLPPGPPGLPILGNFLDIPEADKWIYFYETAKKYSESPPLYIFLHSMYSWTSLLPLIHYAQLRRSLMSCHCHLRARCPAIDASP